MNTISTAVWRAYYAVWYWYTEWRVEDEARSNAYHELEEQGAQVISHYTNTVATETTLALPERADTTAEELVVSETGEQLAGLGWYPLIPFLLCFFGFIGWRGSTRLFLTSGFPPMDAMLLGVMLESFNVLLVWLLHQAWLRPYDGTNKRRVHLTLLSIAYLLLVGCMVALRLGQADPNESLPVRLANCGLLVAAVCGPALAIELLARIGYRIAPLVYRRKQAARVIRHAEAAYAHEVAQREQAAARNTLMSEYATRLAHAYNSAYAKAATRFARERQ